MILDDIKNALEELDENVFYGIADKKMKETFWNYIVFDRGPLRVNTNRTGYSQTYTVHVIREDFVPEDLVFQVIEKMTAIPGMRLSEKECTFDYIQKPNTNIVVEMFSAEFVKPRKK